MNDKRVGILFILIVLFCFEGIGDLTAQSKNSDDGDTPAESSQSTNKNNQTEEKQHEEENPTDKQPSSSKSPLSENDDKKTLKDVLVTAKRHPSENFDTPFMTEVLTDDDIVNRLQARTTPEALQEAPGIMVQKTGYAMGSPYLRGFTSFRTLLMVDGIRLNFPVFRPGPNQYLNTVDAFSIERMEVVKGPASVLYGSDAVGGAINIITKERNAYPEGRERSHRAITRLSSAEESASGRLEMQGNDSQRYGYHLGFSGKDYGDMHGGSDIERHPKTGYSEVDTDFKFNYFLSPEEKLTLAYQHTDIDDAWRTHKTEFGISFAGSTVGDEKKRALDQTRTLTYLRYNSESSGAFFSEMSTTLSFQQQKERRHRVKSDSSFDIQHFDDRSFGVSVQFLSTDTKIGDLTYGLSHYHDRVDTGRTDFNADHTVDKERIQGPVGDDSTYDLFGAYLQDEFSLLSDKLDITLGARFTWAEADSDKVLDPDTDSRIAISDNWSDVVGSVSGLYHVNPNFNVYAGVSEAFRTPNLSDLTRFDSARTDEIETPSPGLDPEDYTNYEIGAKYSSDRISSQLAWFYTDISDEIKRFRTGNIVDGDNEVIKNNIGEGFMRGIEGKARFRLNETWSIFGNATWMEGDVSTFSNPDSSGDSTLVTRPRSRVMPFTGLVGVRYSESKGDLPYWIEGVIQAASEQDELAPRDVTDTQRIPPGGTPGYGVVHLRSGFQLSENFTLNGAVKNILDKDYRIHGSGVNEPGRNFILTGDLKF